MTMSPSASSGRSWSRVDCTTPAGTMIQIARGCSSFATKSSRLLAPVAPSDSSCFTASALRS